MGELPKLFGKAFAVGFLLPAVAFALALGDLLTKFGRLTAPLKTLLEANFAGVTMTIAVLWLGAVCLMALNRPIVRFAEGYGLANPLHLMKVLKVRRFKDLSKRVEDIEAELDAPEARRQRPKECVEQELMTASLHLARNFPDHESFVLSTRFGNVMRAYEVYPRVVYGLEGIQGWTRLVAVLPDSYRAQIEDAKSQTDFWINIWALSSMMLGIYFYLAFFPSVHFKHLWMAVVCLMLCLGSLPLATMMAREWGELVMSAFDLYRGDLAKQLGLDLPRSIVHERAMWTAFSQMTIYRSIDAANDLGRFRTKSGI